MVQKVVYTEIPYDDLKLDVRQIIKEELLSIQQKQFEEKLLSAEETRQMFSPKISRTTLYNWTEQKLLKKYVLGGRIWYKLSEIMEAAKHLQKYHAK